jgi:hypothetical protein
MNWHIFLFCNVGCNHLIGQIPDTDCQVSPRPERTPPEHAPRVCEFLKHYSGSDCLQPLRNPAHLNMRQLRDPNVNAVAGCLAGQDCYLVLLCYLPDEVARTNRDISRRYLPSIFWNPN